MLARHSLDGRYRIMCGLFAMALTCGVNVEAAELRLLAGAAIAPALNDISRRFEADTAHKLAIEYVISDTLRAKIQAREAFDFYLIGDDSMEDAAKAGLIERSTRALVARVGMAMAVRAGGARPDINSAQSFRRTLLNAKSVSYPPKGAIGIHLAKVYAELGIAEQMASKVKAVQGPDLVPNMVASGQAELGFAPATVLIAGTGIEVMPLPDAVQSYIVYSGAVGAGTKQPDAAIAFGRYLAAPSAVELMKGRGFQTGGAR
jgi:molybdate transport system substrate-binding protein